MALRFGSAPAMESKGWPDMNILMLTNEYPPHIYGGAGVHVDHLVRALGGRHQGRHQLQVLCFGDQFETATGRSVTGIGPARDLSGLVTGHRKLLDALHRNIVMAGSAKPADIVHCHTWYTFLAGCLLKQLLEVPLVVTTHSLEPHRPWKQDQLGTGYHVTGWLEKTALENADRVIAVSAAMQTDVISLFNVAQEKVRVIHNGIDPQTYCETRDDAVLEACGIAPSLPFVLFVGRETRQKGIIHLIRAFGRVRTPVQLVLCSGAADTPEVSREVDRALDELRAQTDNRVVRIREMVPVDQLRVLYSHAAVFVCPSVYEPFGIINLEAMACGTPVVASAVGGIPEVVTHDETGLLVPFAPRGAGDPEPQDPGQFAQDLAAAIEHLLRSPQKRAAMAAAARQRVEKHFSWGSIARQTLALYGQLTDAR
jgi:glycogen synthase